jgi:pimeloyl-ACP methyl ester carboxylesterase
MALSFDPSRVSLYSPEQGKTVWDKNSNPTSHALAAEASRLAYYRAESSGTQEDQLKQALLLVNFGEVALFVNPSTGTFGFGAVRKSDNTVLIAFRGTQPDDAADFATDIDVLPQPWEFGQGEVHIGFAEAYSGIHKELKSWLESLSSKGNVIVIGHSLGGAIAVLAAAALKPTALITFGCPRVGNTVFCNSLNGVATQQFVNCCDIIARIPPRNFLDYDDVCSPTYIDHSGAILSDPSDTKIKSDRSLARRKYFQTHAWRVGNVLIRDLADHAPVNYLRAFY